jgi:hypothetical protein
MSRRREGLDLRRLFGHSLQLHCFFVIDLCGASLFLLQYCEYPHILYIAQVSVSGCRHTLLVSLGWKTSAAPDAIRVLPASRFGNHVIELAHGLHYSALIGVQIVYINPNFLCINRTVNTTAGVRICIDRQPPRQRVLVGVFYNLVRLTRCVAVNYTEIIATFRSVVLENMPHPSPIAAMLFVYLRGGDIFIPPVNRFYGQPPCGYYLEAIEMDNAIDIHIISEDNKNPCLTIVLEQTGAQWKSRSLITDITDLIYAKRMIIARGTFSLAAVWLSPFQKVFYATAQYRGPLGEHMECCPTAVYWHTMMDNWTASIEQLAQMVSEGCKRWVLQV